MISIAFPNNELGVYNDFCRICNQLAKDSRIISIAFPNNRLGGKS